VFGSFDTSSNIRGVHQCMINSRNSSCSSSDSRLFTLEISSRSKVPDVVDATTTTSKSGYRYRRHHRQGLRLIMRVNGIDKIQLALTVSSKTLISSLASTESIERGVNSYKLWLLISRYSLVHSCRSTNIVSRQRPVVGRPASTVRRSFI
jgi:hypothetical protein